MPLIIDPNDTSYLNSVRNLLGGVDDVTLPDSDINDPAILDMAELKVIEMLPNYSDFTDPSDILRIRLAVIHIMASLLCPSMSNRVEVEVKSIDTGWKKKPIDYAELAVDLFNKALELLAPLGIQDGLYDDSKIFVIAPSKRAVKEQEEDDETYFEE